MFDQEASVKVEKTSLELRKIASWSMYCRVNTLVSGLLLTEWALRF
jgi:hypothetical protein